MPLDGISAHFLNNEINQALEGARVNQVLQQDANSLYMSFRKGRENIGLNISINPARSFIYLSQKPPNKKSGEHSSFSRLLRQQIMGAEFQGSHNPEFERIFQLTFKTINEIGDFEDKTLIAEIMGKHSNLILLRPNGIIHDAMRHVDHSVNRYREIMPARPYVMPPSQDKLAITKFEADLKSYLEGAVLLPFLQQDNHREVHKVIVNNLAGFSPLLARDLVFRAGLDDKLYLSDLSTSERLRLSKILAEFFEKYLSSQLGPGIYYQDQSKQNLQDFHAFDLAIFKSKDTFPSLSAAMESYYSQKLIEQEIKLAKESLLRKLTRIEKNNERRRLLHEEDLREGSQSDKFKLYGDLLQAKIYQIPPKASEIEVENYYEEDLPLITIPLDPSLNPAQNVDYYYHSYRRAKEKHKRASQFLAQDQQNEEWLANLWSQFDRAESLDDLDAIEDELDALEENKAKIKSSSNEEDTPLGQILNPGRPGRKDKYRQPKKRAKKAKQKQSQTKVHEFRKFRTSDGYLVQVGRNNLENDRLTFRKSRKDDLWFHAKGIPGSHTVLHLEGKEASDQAILEAASIAAYYSSANKTALGARVEVDYTQIRNVSKISGAKPGLVNYTGQTTIYAEAQLPQLEP